MADRGKVNYESHQQGSHVRSAEGRLDQLRTSHYSAKGPRLLVRFAGISTKLTTHLDADERLSADKH